eukprot:209291_1
MLSLLFAQLIISAFAVDNSEIIEGGNEFGYDLSNKLFTDESTNLWISPFCITSCFALIYPGSNGETQTQIANVLGYPTGNSVDASDITQQFFTLQSSIESTFDGVRTNEYDPKPSVIGIANKIYSSRSLTLKQPFIDALNDGTHSFIDYDFDFAADNATTIINTWVKDNTNGLIDSIIPEDADISPWRLVAMNAIFLNGSFHFQFAKEFTSAHTFYSNSRRDAEFADCHLMHQIEDFDYYSDGDYQFLKFPFTDSNDLLVLFALPINEDLYENKNGLITDSDVITTAIQNLESNYVALALPKLSIEAMYTLNEPLKELGMVNAFESSADFSGISDTALQIDVVIHKTMVEMDEKGLVAAAVTLISMVESAVVEKPTPILFKADHPFQMIIIDGSHDDNILFMGQVNDPGIPEGSDTPVYDESVDSIWSDFTLYIDDDDDDDSSGAVTNMNCSFVAVCTAIVVVKLLLDTRNV